MSENRLTHLADWGFRLLIITLTILWLVFPPRGAEAVSAARPSIGHLP